MLRKQQHFPAEHWEFTATNSCNHHLIFSLLSAQGGQFYHLCVSKEKTEALRAKDNAFWLYRWQPEDLNLKVWLLK